MGSPRRSRAPRGRSWSARAWSAGAPTTSELLQLTRSPRLLLRRVGDASPGSRCCEAEAPKLIVLVAPPLERRKELEEKTAAARGLLDAELADAVQAGDLAAANAAFAKGAALDLYNVEGMEELDTSAAWITEDALPDLNGAHGSGEPDDALPLICSVVDNIPMVNWLLDNGADVNARRQCEPAQRYRFQ